MSDIVHALYRNQTQAQQAVEALLEEHVAPRDVTLITRDQSDIPQPAIARVTTMGRDGIAGGALGALAGAILVPAHLLGVSAASTIWEMAQLICFTTVAGVMAGTLRGLGRWEQRVRSVGAGEIRLAVNVGTATGLYAARIRAILVRTGGCQVGTIRRRASVPVCAPERVDDDTQAA